MELLLLSALLLLTLFFSLSLIKILYYNNNSNNLNYSKSKNLPPGQMGWPIVGETLDFLSMGRKGIPEKFFEDRMKKHSSRIFKTSLFGQNVAVLCGNEGNKFLFSNENKLVAVWWPEKLEKIFPTAKVNSIRELSFKIHKSLQGFFKFGTLQKYVGIMDCITRQHVETHWISTTTSTMKQVVVVVLPLAKQYSFNVVCRLFLSIDELSDHNLAKLQKHFDKVIMGGIVSLPIDLPGTRFNRGIKAANVIRAELLRIIKQRKVCLMEGKQIPDHELLVHFLTTRDDDETGGLMSDVSVADAVLVSLIGAYDSIASTIIFTMKYLAEMPDIYDKVLKEQREVADGKPPGEMLNLNDLQKMKYSWNVVREVLRLVPPLPGNYREAIADFTYDGFFLYPQRMEDYFPEPDKFDPSRFDGDIGAQSSNYAYVPFGGGPKMCPGREFARVGILVFMYNVVRKFRWEKVIPDEKIVMDPFAKPVNGLPIRLHPI